MKILQINSGNFGSTGNIMLGIAEAARAQGHVCYTACPDARSTRKKVCRDQIFIGNRYARNLHIQLGKLTGYQGVFSILDTWQFLRKLDGIGPDVIHMHNMHNCYINLPMLFRYIKRKQIPVVWTLHDCWTFTGYCPHFLIAKCEKWKTGCYKCPQYKNYPESYVDRSVQMWKLKKKWFTGVQNMTIVTPSQWLADLAKQSFWKGERVQVIHNGIDLSVFKPTENDFAREYGIPENKKILLGVSFCWEERKGLDVFLELANRLEKDKYQIVLVGTDDQVDKLLPEYIISIHRTQNQQELAEIYSAADLFVNPTREENYPTVNMEAIACGTPVLTFRTGGSPEIPDASSGSVVPCNDIQGMEDQIRRICQDKPYSKEACLNRAKTFDRGERFLEYVRLYEKIVSE